MTFFFFLLSFSKEEAFLYGRCSKRRQLNKHIWRLIYLSLCVSVCTYTHTHSASSGRLDESQCVLHENPVALLFLLLKEPPFPSNNNTYYMNRPRLVQLASCQHTGARARTHTCDIKVLLGYFVFPSFPQIFFFFLVLFFLP